MIPENPQFLYPLLRAEEDGRTIIGRYAATAAVTLDASRFHDVTIVNATKAEETLLRFYRRGRSVYGGAAGSLRPSGGPDHRRGRGERNRPAADPRRRAGCDEKGLNGRLHSKPPESA